MDDTTERLVELMGTLDAEGQSLALLAVMAIARGNPGFADRVFAYAKMPMTDGYVLGAPDEALFRSIRACCDVDEAACWGQAAVYVALRGDGPRATALESLMRARVAS